MNLPGPLEQGYYKVKYASEWMIALWTEHFTICGYEDWLRPEDMQEIGDHVPCP